MEVDKTGSSDSAAAQRIAQKKRDQEIEEQKVQIEIARAQREREKAVSAEREKGDRELVEISNQASNHMESMRKLNSDRVHALNENQQKNYEVLAAKTAEELSHLEGEAKKTIEAHKFSSMEKIKNSTSRGEDPFYRMKGLSPTLTENENEYTVKVTLPEHEAQNLFISAEGPYLKLALNRRFQESAKAPEGNGSTSTNSYQSVVEQVAMPGGYDGRKIARSYENGVVTVTIPKVKFPGTGKA